MKKINKTATCTSGDHPSKKQMELLSISDINNFFEIIINIKYKFYIILKWQLKLRLKLLKMNMSYWRLQIINLTV